MGIFGGKTSASNGSAATAAGGGRQQQQLPTTTTNPRSSDLSTKASTSSEAARPRGPTATTTTITNVSSSKKSSSSGVSKRPRPKPMLNRTPSIQTRYMDMLLSLDRIPRLHNILASFFTWILLAGFIVFPGTFTSLKSEDDEDDTSSTGKLQHKIINTVVNVPLLWIGGACCVVGGIGMLGLWLKWRRNYVWLINKIFMPGFLNSIAGLISTIVNVYTARNKTWSVTAKATAIATGSCSGALLVLFVVYNHIALARVKRSHERDMELEGRGHEHETMGEKAKRLATEPALEPSSVV